MRVYKCLILVLGNAIHRGGARGGVGGGDVGRG